MYVAIVGAYIAGFSPIAFALFSALVLGLGLCAHSVNLTSPAINSTERFTTSIRSGNNLVPALSESMAELHTLQKEINELQAKFSNDVDSQSGQIFPNGSAG